MEINIFEYTDYRQFLKDYYTRSKEDNQNFSYRYFAQKAGISSSNCLHMVISGKRSLNRDYLLKFAKGIGLNKKEQNYLETLVSFSKAKTPEARRYYMELLNGFKNDKIGNILSTAQYEFLSNWYYPVIREMVMLPDFCESYIWIRTKLNNKVSIREIRRAIEGLLKLELLKRDESGKLVQTDNVITTEDTVRHTAAYSFHKQMLVLAHEMLEKVSDSKREALSVTMALTEQQINEVKKMILQFKNDVVDHVVKTQNIPEAVYQMSVYLFPLTGKTGGNNE